MQFENAGAIWSSKPGRLVVASTIGDILIISTIALTGIAMTALPASVVAGTFAAAIAFAFVLDAVKVPVFHWLKIS